MTEKKAKDTAQADDIGAQCESLCDAVHDLNENHAFILRAVYRDKASNADIARALRMPLDRVIRERAYALATAFDVVTHGTLSRWPTPVAEGVPELGMAPDESNDQTPAKSTAA